jgi:hypothetical protein
MREQVVQFACLGYIDASQWDARSKSEQDAVVAECCAYDAMRYERGYWVEGGQALQSVQTAKTL